MPIPQRQKKQHLLAQSGLQEVQSDPEPSRNWEAYWKEQGQLWRREPEIDEKRQQLLSQRLRGETDRWKDIDPSQEKMLTRADIEWLLRKKQDGSAENENEHWKTLDLREAILNGVDLQFLPLERADFTGARLERANFFGAELEGANFGVAQLERANFGVAQLKGARFTRARLEGAHFDGVQLEGTSFRDTFFADSMGVGPIFANAIGWSEVFLADIEWGQIKVFGEEAEANKKVDTTGKGKKTSVRLNEYRVAVRTYRQVATALEGQGLKEEAERFAYRAQVMQRKVLWWSMRQKRRKNQKRRAFIGQRVNTLGSYLFSLLLALLTGYGYRFGRSLVSYLCVILVFAFFYLSLSQETKQPLEWIDAAILSISDMVGRGFFRQDVSLSDPYAGWSVLEGMIGVFMDVLLISTLTQRLFKK